MGRMRRADASGLYEGVMQRVAHALELAEAAGSEPLELELEGLSDSELAFIRAFLQRDASWLSGWHAAAREQARLARQAQHIKMSPTQQIVIEPRAVSLDCALCGTQVPWPGRPGVVFCSACGSALMKAFRQTDGEAPG